MRNDTSLAESLGESQLQEGMDMLNHILATRVKLLGETHIATGEAKYTLGLMYLFMGAREQARECVAAACDIYSKHLGPDHPSTRDVAEVLQQLAKSMVSFDGDGADAGPHAGTPADGLFEGFETHFPKDMPRAATQSPIPMPPSAEGGL